MMSAVHLLAVALLATFAYGAPVSDSPKELLVSSTDVNSFAAYIKANAKPRDMSRSVSATANATSIATATVQFFMYTDSCTTGMSSIDTYGNPVVSQLLG